MEYSVPNTIVPQDVIDEYLKTYLQDPSLTTEILNTSEQIKSEMGCNQPHDGHATVHLYVGPQGVGKSSMIARDSKTYNSHIGNKAIVIDRFAFMQRLDSFQSARMRTQDHYDGNDVEKLHKELEGVTARFLPAALWIENDVMTCAVQNNRTIFVETSGRNTLPFINRLEAAGAEVVIHACIAPLQVLLDAADARYAQNPDFAISGEQIEEEYQRLIEILPLLCRRPNEISLFVRQNADRPLELVSENLRHEAEPTPHKYFVGVLDGILGNHRMSFANLMKQRDIALSREAKPRLQVSV